MLHVCVYADKHIQPRVLLWHYMPVYHLFIPIFTVRQSNDKHTHPLQHRWIQAFRTLSATRFAQFTVLLRILRLHLQHVPNIWISYFHQIIVFSNLKFKNNNKSTFPIKDEWPRFSGLWINIILINITLIRKNSHILYITREILNKHFFNLGFNFLTYEIANFLL